MEKLGGDKKERKSEERERKRKRERNKKEIEKRERDKNGIKKLNMRIRILISYNFYIPNFELTNTRISSIGNFCPIFIGFCRGGNKPLREFPIF